MSYYPIIFHNAIYTLTKTWLQALKSHYINNVNQSTYYLIGTSFLPAKHIPFPHCSFLWMSSILAHQVPTVLQVPIQATQHKDDTNPLCISSVLLRVLCRYSFLWMVLHPSTPSANSSHPTQWRYPVPLLGVSPFVLFRVLHQAEALRSRTPPQCLEVILFTESPTLVTVLSMCAERVLTKISCI